ncbi:hypothetical protein [uncultured Roseobacter sp.]|uniref:hypothetical protein n=1 Tax=uncultured Roseobacter sp. TaxID=114847 RepID=UPI0026180EE8|nr:hypothetical protein [uncultured Roseobacter sp.]
MNTINTSVPTTFNASESIGTRSPFFLLTEFLAPVALVVAVVLVIQIDVRLLGNTLPENSMTEFFQGALVIFSALVFAMRARRETRSRGYLVVGATLFACMFIRENDGMLDHVQHGFWIIPAAVVALLGGFSAYFWRDSIKEPFMHHFETRETTFIFIGLLVLLVFSRLFGTGSLWQPVMGEGYDTSFKTVVQEGLELLGYSLIAYGSVRSGAYCEQAGDPVTS